MRLGRPRWVLLTVAAAVAVLAATTAIFWGDLMQSWLDPKTPFQTYDPPPEPDYAKRESWALMPTNPAEPGPADPPSDVFFVSPTTYDGGRDWNASVADPKADRVFRQVMAPNYAGPFVRVGRIFAPRYRQAGLYSLLTLNDDAREARRFAYHDVAEAFRRYLADYNDGRPFVLVGVEQGGLMALRLAAEEIAAQPEVRRKLVAAYLIDTAVPADRPPLAPCRSRGETGCLAAWLRAPTGQEERARVLLARALVWSPQGELENLGRRPSLCFNPILGSVTDEAAPARLHLGGANATGLEWGARPAFLARQTAAQCKGGVLRVTSPRSTSLRPSGSWIERHRAPGFNLFYADLEADAAARVKAMAAEGFNLRPSAASPPASRTAPAAP